MPLKNGNTVAVERRMDLASLFCMIGRHGPAVALAVIAMVSVLAGFIIYRTVRGKRRKATDAAADGDGKSRGAERDASVIQPSPEESHSSVESTDVSDDSSSDLKEDINLIQSDLKIRHRRAAAAAAAERTPPPYPPPKSDIQVSDNKLPTSDDAEEVAAVWDSYKVPETDAEEVNQNLLSDAYAGAEMMVDDAVDWHRGETDDTVKPMLDEFHDNDSCLKEPWLINDESHEEEEKVLKAECQEDENVTAGEKVSDKITREEDDFQYALNNTVCFEQILHMSENSTDDRLQDVTTTNSMESNPEEPVIHTEDAIVPCVSHGKDEDFEEENPDYSSYSVNNCLSSEEEQKNESEEAEEEGLDHQVIAPQAEIWPSASEQETNLPEQCGLLTDEVTVPIRDNDWAEDVGQAGQEDIDEDHLNKLVAVELDACSPPSDEQDVEIEQKKENGLTGDQEDGFLFDIADQVEENMLSGDSIVSCNEERDNSSVLPCLSIPVNAENNDSSPSGVSGIAEFVDLSLDFQQPQTEDKIAPSLDEDIDSTLPDPQMLSHETENQLENKKDCTPVMLAEECDDQVCDHHVQSGYKDQPSFQTERNEAFDESSVDAVPDTAGNEIASVIVEEIPCPYPSTICQENQSDHVETFEETTVYSANDATACNNASYSALAMPEEISCPDISSSTKSDQTTNKDFSQGAANAAPIKIADVNPPTCQIQFSSFEQFELRHGNISVGVGEESGISSMTVSPDAGNEFDVIFENITLAVMDCDLQSDGQTEAQNSLFADNAGMVFRPYPSHHSQPAHSEQSGWNNDDSFAANEDTFGHEIEDSYHKAMDQFMVQIADSITSFPNELEKQSDIKVVVEVKEKKVGVSVEKKEESDAEKEKEEDKTEISIMEATMDHNEWIMDGNYQTLPWLNLSAPSFAQDHTKTNQLPTEECQYSSAVSDAACIAATDIPASTEVQTSTLSLVDDCTETNKKVVAVQPMPQYVNVTFRVHYFTQSPYQKVAITGNQQELGNWKGFIPLERSKDGHWATVVSLPVESHVEWKFVVVDKGEVCRWEECGNRLLDTGYGDDLLVHKWWGRL